MKCRKSIFKWVRNKQAGAELIWVGQIKIKDQLSPAEAAIEADLGKKGSSLVLHFLQRVAMF